MKYKKTPASKIVFATIITGMLCQLTPAMFAQNNGSEPSSARVSRIYGQICESDARKGVKRDPKEIYAEALDTARREYVPGRSSLSPASSTGKDAVPFLQAGPAIMYSSPKGDSFDSAVAYGVVFEGGVVMFDHHYVSLGIGALFATEDYSFGRITVRENITTVPLMLTYNYLFYLDRAHEMSLRVGPTVGVSVVNYEFKSGDYSVSDSAWTFAGGLSIGFRWEFGENWFLDISERLYASSGYTVSVAGLEADSGSIYGSQTAICVGAKF